MKSELEPGMLLSHRLAAILASLAMGLSLGLDAAEEQEPPQELAPIQVEDVRDRLERAGRVKDSIIRTEVISAAKMEKNQAKTLTEAVQNEAGIQAGVGCSICGMKRVQINGMKGEYTTVLVDGIPMHSTVSSYYGMDALTTAGVARIEVARGAGASLLAPGALAGTLNIISEKATSSGLFLDMSGGNYGYQAYSLVSSAVNDSGKRRTTVAAQHNSQAQWDADHNGVNESPKLGNYSLSTRVSQDLGGADNLDLRLVVQRSDVFGGPMAEGIFKGTLATGNPSFDGGDVRNTYTGPAGATLETIQTKRLEGIAKWTHEFNPQWNTVLSMSGVQQGQDSYYEGNDYLNEDNTFYSDLRATWQINKEHTMTFGGDGRYETLRSQSHSYFDVAGIAKDDFDFASYGLYAQEAWTPLANLEVAGALRLDHLAVNWRGQTAQLNEIDQFVLVPRLHVRWNHAESWTSRLGLGQGYRAPLTFFESEHGILDDGFNVLISEIEQSDSAVYSLSFDNRRMTSTLSTSWSRLRHMATIDNDATHFVRPTLVTHPGTFNLFTTDVVWGYQLTPDFLLGASYEHFWYPISYTMLLPFAAIEDRVKFLVDYEAGGLSWNLTCNIIGPRNLRHYNYEDRYNDLAKTSQKLLDAPAYLTLDGKVSYEVSKDFTLYAGVKNLLNYTQASRENPLFWDSAGNYDVIHIWGPLRGREVYAGLTAKF